jgi:hypothetical protein
MTRRRRLVLPIAAALVGLLLFSYVISSVGWSTIVDGIRRVGWGMVPILALAGVRFVLRAAAWRLCIPPHARLSLPQAFAAFLSGDSVGNVTPLGLFASEPTKLFLIRHRLATREAVSSLAADFVIYSTSAVTMIVFGLTLLLATVPLSLGFREIVIAALVVLAGVLYAVWRLLGGSTQPERGPRPPWRARLATVRDSVMAFAATHPERLWRVFVLDLAFQAVAVVEVFLTLRWLLPEPPSLVNAVIFSALDRAVIIAFKFVPFRLGIDEIATGGLAGMLWGPAAAATGVALALIKKVRSIFWVGVGLMLIAAHPSQGGPGTDLPGNGSARPI